ncbi:MAG: RHS repeat-associated core domain-containing protein [Deltaproteobacteria bacterium]|nr:RHS repeat-associated core domain-containing protein [Deltaproteobacteria bacterium]
MTASWTGYDPVTHRAAATVVQQLSPQYAGAPSKATLLSFGYEYDRVGKLKGVADYRGRPNDGQHETSLQESGRLKAPHPVTVNAGQDIAGYHQPGMPADFDGSMTAPTKWNASDALFDGTKWPLGAAPSDAVLGYDSLYQLVSEDREYATGTGDDVQQAQGEAPVSRVRQLDWGFDPLGSMTEWLEGGTGQAEHRNQGRALGVITNGYALNLAGGCNMSILSTGGAIPAGCFRPDALYFASNVDDAGPGRGTCVWVEYDGAGRMDWQVVRTGCSVCAYDAVASDRGVAAATCPGDATTDPAHPVEAHVTRYEYTWNAVGELGGAKKRVDGVESVTMSYIYDASGARVIREKSEAASDPTNIRQDLYVSGGYERRQVQLRDAGGTPVSVNAAVPGEAYANLEGTRLVRYSSGLRIENDYDETSGELTDRKMFLSFGNHLGSTSAVVDYNDGTLVEWRTAYAYGADESHWKSDDPRYADADEPYKFTGKEEDEAVGLFYFGARYYSAILGRWLSPDPVSTHQGAMESYYGYGGNSPYIAIDPDGRIANFIIGAIVGAIIGAVVGAIKGGWKGAIIGAAVGAVVGAATSGAGSAAASGAAAAGMGATASGAVGAAAAGAVAGAAGIVQAKASGATWGQSFLAGGISFACGAIGGVAGAGISSAGVGAASSTLAGLGIGASLSGTVTLTEAAVATDGDLSKANWDSLAADWAMNVGASALGAAVGAGLGNLTGNGAGAGEEPRVAQGTAPAPKAQGGNPPVEVQRALADPAVRKIMAEQARLAVQEGVEKGGWIVKASGGYRFSPYKNDPLNNQAMDVLPPPEGTVFGFHIHEPTIYDSRTAEGRLNLWNTGYGESVPTKADAKVAVDYGKPQVVVDSINTYYLFPGGRNAGSFMPIGPRIDTNIAPSVSSSGYFNYRSFEPMSPHYPMPSWMNR